MQTGLAIGTAAARLLSSGRTGMESLEDFHCNGLAVRRIEFSPCPRVWRETSDEVVNALCRLIPVDAARLSEDFGGGLQLVRRREQLTLVNGLHRPRKDVIHRLRDELGSEHHQAVVNVAHAVGLGYRHTHLLDDATRIYLMLEEDTKKSLEITE